MNKRKSRKIGILVLLVVSAYCIYTLICQESLLGGKKRELDDIKQKIAAEEKKKKDLQDEKKNLNSDEHMEKVAREKLGMVKSGEKVFVDVNK